MAAAIASALAAQVEEPASWWICWQGENVKLTDDMKKDYETSFGTCTVKPEKRDEVEAIVTRIMKNRLAYEELEAASSVPWYVIAVMHNMEAGGRFDRHLHNGDPLTRRTVNVPAARPVAGKPPFTFRQSALDALEYDGLTTWTNWSVPGILFRIEGFNGFGYRGKGVPTPYLWGGSNHERPGKYVADGKWDPAAQTKQIGAAVLLRRLVDQALVEMPKGPGAR
jgi:lysozyme family protein